MPNIQELTSGVVKKIEEVSHLLRKSREFLEWAKYLKTNTLRIKRVTKNKVYNSKTCFKLESDLALLIA